MKIGRREFLKFIGLAVAGVALDPLASVIRNQNYFVNQKLGFGFIVPDAWEVEAFGDFDYLRGKQRLSSFDSEFEREVVEELSDGLAAIIKKYPGKDSDRFSPSITFFMSPNDVLEEFKSLDDFVDHSVSVFESVLTAYECIEPPSRINATNFEAIRFKATFLFEHDYIDSLYIDDETWIINHGGTLYTLHMYDSPYNNEDTSKEFIGFKESLHIA
ncbi:hypothetical protein MHO82_06040 [Vibrio sp. Of7-15]|uniref:hypothetical protein n=1 Tax=Vibrio sp. Of7-15 TaxID=2724879 RepID=UPI001EF1D244|nr:hypothetical protein [Vibrio sp. Of7-15]MCG7496415.1 hypothetical protein [Vibrio sp. Of7-15]